jgi:hypothetical protein
MRSDSTSSPEPNLLRTRSRAMELLYLVGVVFLYVVLMRYILPWLGVPT